MTKRNVFFIVLMDLCW